MKICYSCFENYNENLHVCPYCGHPEINEPIEPIHLIPGTVLAKRYYVGQAVGSGGFGVVYKAWDSKLETIVAIKEFYVSRLVTRAGGQKNVIVSKKAYEEFNYRKKRFLAEARTMARFGNHRSIPNVFEYFEENNTAYIVMELLEGETLGSYLKEHPTEMSIDFSLMVIEEVAQALKSLHVESIIHRDVAPDNIFICKGKNIGIKLMDLGAAKLQDATDDIIDIILKPGYSPAEQYNDADNIGPWSDVYALGATLYVMLTGVKPDEASNRKIKDTVVQPKEINPKISENLNNAIMRAMAVEMHLRFKDVDEFLSALSGEKKVISIEEEKKKRKIKRFSTIAVALFVVIIGALFGLKTFGDKKYEAGLEPAEIDVWFSVVEGSQENEAMQTIKADFEARYPGVILNLNPIEESVYSATLQKAAEEDSLPDLFESTGLNTEIIEKANDLDVIMESDFYAQCLFLDDYDDYYSNKKQMPIAIEVPMAYIVLKSEKEQILYDAQNSFFNSLSDFNYKKIAVDSRCKSLIQRNFGDSEYIDLTLDYDDLFNDGINNTAVLLSSTMTISENVRMILRKYSHSYVYPNNEKIYCNFTYEWSVGKGSDDETRAAERLLTWFMGNAYQNYLMIAYCNNGNEGPIPINQTTFMEKTNLGKLVPIKEIYSKFVFEREG